MNTITSAWQFEDNYIDSVGGNDANTASYNFLDAKVNRGVDSFMGSSSNHVYRYMTVPNNSSLDLIGAFSCSFFSYPMFSGAKGTILSKSANTAVTDYQIIQSANYNKVEVRLKDSIDGGTVVFLGTASLPQLMWSHVVITFNGTDTILVYINGVLSTGATTVTGTFTEIRGNANPLYLCGIPGSGGRAWRLRAYLDELILWNIELTSEQALLLHSLQDDGTDILI